MVKIEMKDLLLREMASFFLSDKFMPQLQMFHREVVAFEYSLSLGITPRIISKRLWKKIVMERLDKTLSELVEKCEFSPPEKIN